MAFFIKIEVTILKCVWNHKIPPIGKVIFKKTNIARGITLLDFKLYYELWHWKEYGIGIKNRHRDEWNKTGSPQINPSIYGKLIFNKGAKNIYTGEKIIFSINGAEKTGYPHPKE